LKVLAELILDSTAFRAPPGLMEGEMVMFFSSKFAANNNAGPTPLFTPRDWSTELSTGLLLFLCFKQWNANY
jgi:hypothetical protein